MFVRAVTLVVFGLTSVMACGGTEDSTIATPWIEEPVTFSFEGDDLYGVMTRPPGESTYPAVVLVSGSEGPTGGRSGVSTSWFVDHSRLLARHGFAVLRYDPPGVGRSTGEPGLPSLQRRAEETAAALSALRSSGSVAPDRAGLLGVSQGGWVIAMTAQRYPDDVAFLISVVGSGQSVAHQQIYGIESQSRAAGLSDGEVIRAVLFGRLLIDWQLTEPIFEDVNRADAAALGAGAWTDLVNLVYRPNDLEPADELEAGIEIMRSVRDEPWAAALYLDELYLPRFEAIPSDITGEQLAAIQSTVEESLLTSPDAFLTEIRVPVLAVFGELDVNVDTATSAARFDQYLTEAGNDDVTIVVLPGVGHDIDTSTPGYADTVTDWLTQRFGR